MWKIFGQSTCSGQQQLIDGVQKRVSTSPLTYMPVLDGLRGIAIISVLLFHLQPSWAPLGWAGVWLFFVLSGYLITEILLNAKDSPCYFRTFYSRRILRIFPAYFLLLLVLIVIALSTGQPITDAPYFLTFTQNFLQAAKHFHVEFPKTATVTWSLAVEEQFYLLWPLIIRFSSLQRIRQICGAFLVLAPLARLICLYSSSNPFYQYTLLFTQIDSLGLGAFLACILRCNLGALHLRKIASWFMLFGLSGSLVYIDFCGGPIAFAEPYNYLNHAYGCFFYTFLNLFFGGLLLLLILAERKNLKESSLIYRLRSVLTIPPLLYIGRISYGIYLYHLTVWLYIDPLIRTYFHPFTEYVQRGLHAAVLIGAVIVMAELSARFIERPILSLKTRL